MSSHSQHRRRACRKRGFLGWRSPLGWLALSLVVLAAGRASALDAGAPGGTGDELVPLRAILKSIARAGVPLIYSTETVPPELKAHIPPPELPLDERLRWLLAPFGLEARPLTNGAYVVVPASRKLGQLAVTVTLEHSGRIEPLPGASVSLIGANRDATSDASGHVEFADLIPGRYQLEAQYHGLRSVQRKVQLPAGAGEQVELRLASVPALLEEIRIEGTRVDAGAGASLGRFVAREMLESNPTTSNDAARTLQLVPGTAIAGYTAKTHVRGSRDDETLFRYDGLTLIDPYHLEALQSLNSALDPAVIDTATAWTSAPPIQFGGRIGAVVDLEPRAVMAPIADAQLSNRDINLTAGTPFAAAQGTVLASMRMANDSSPARWLETDSLTPSFRDYLLRTTWSFGPRTRLAAGVLGIDDQLDTLSNERAPLDQRARLVSHERYVWLRWWQALTDDIRSETLVSAERSGDQAFGRLVVPGIEAGYLARSDRHSAVTIREELTFQPAVNWSWLVGAERTEATVEEVLRGNASFQPPFVPGLQPLASLSTDEAAAIRALARSCYSSVQWQRGGRSIDLGLRRDDRQFSMLAAADAYWSASASVKQQLSGSTVLRFGWSRTTQASVLELVQGADGAIRPSAARLLTQVDVGLDSALGPHWLLRTDVYHKRERSPFSGSEDVFTPFALLPEIALGTVAVNSTSARMSGVEVQLKSDPLLPLSGWVSYARSRAEDRVAGRWVPRSWDQPNAVQIGTRWWSGPWQVTGLFSWHTGWPSTPLQTSSPVWMGPRAVTVGLAARNSIRTASPGSLDIRISWDHPMQRGLAQVALEINDLTNSKTICCHSYSVAQRSDGSSQIVDTPGYWLGFSPKLTFRWRM
jgi:Carboxypeptidase regulatory-like domain